jgi:hypothetical protein
VKVVRSNWEVSRTLTIEFTVPETSSVSFFDVYPGAAQYDALHTNQAVDVRYLPRKYLPDVPGAKILWELHALPTARLASMEGVSRLDALMTPNTILGCAALGGIFTLFMLWRITRLRLFAWSAGIGAVPLFGLILMTGFPRATPAPVREVRHGTGCVIQIGRIDKLFSGSRSRGVIAEQPVDVVSVEFVPEGRTEAVVAVDLIDRGSIADLREKSAVALVYEAASPRTAYLEGARRTFPERNFSGVVEEGLICFAVVAAVLAALYYFSRRRQGLLFWPRH